MPCTNHDNATAIGVVLGLIWLAIFVWLPGWFPQWREFLKVHGFIR